MDGDVEVGAGPLPRSVPDSLPGRIDLIVREGRGRLGGTMFLDLLIQRARANGRRVKPMDGDLKSRTLSSSTLRTIPGAERSRMGRVAL